MITKVYDELKAKFSSIYANLPEPEKVQVIALSQEQVLSFITAITWTFSGSVKLA